MTGTLKQLTQFGERLHPAKNYHVSLESRDHFEKKTGKRLPSITFEGDMLVAMGE